MTRTIPVIIALIIVAVLTIILCTFIGPAGFGFVTTAPGAVDIVGGIRLPRVLAAFSVGASLAVAGAAMQALFRNPMADPYILGTSSGGALGASLALVFLGGFFVPVCAWIGAVAAILIVWLIAGRGGVISTETLLLTGIAVSFFFSAIVSFLISVAGQNVHQILFWLMGGFWNASPSDAILSAGILVPAGFLLFFMGRDLNALSLGEETAAHLGIDAARARWTVLGGSTLLVAGAVSIAGSIGFIGLVTPHIVRLLLGPDNRMVIPASILAGGILLVVSDTLARTFFSDLPVGIITAFIGAPFFIWLIYRRGALS
ncbi:MULTISPECIES: iron ABC transporter permease [unclassified Methanoregula]|uniref:FecCD family ABC transporter permease n=1 Tax=unclassified Methanoregula TaxID=2649730 RepID=UPI0009D62777|nr:MULTISPECIES: iron chelate uptake ABC transporter family permease subunit [unclassified Methanoregula]OPX64396.1 MAG: Cobalamin import system permease protein BtuC [Methanoregula sp. PtaB.Bin085]OPY34934.1 MAG: Cobalamin import system permease protein BtuC [Methanoregula sp. PtaU1.Bin006]